MGMFCGAEVNTIKIEQENPMNIYINKNNVMAFPF